MLALPRARKNKTSSSVFSMSKRASQHLHSGGRKASLVRSSEDALFAGRLCAKNALARAAGLFERDTAHGGLRLFFNLRFAIRAATPPCERKASFDSFLEFAIVGGLDGMRFAKLESAVMKGLLNLNEQLRDRGRNPLLRHEGFSFLAGTVTPGQHY